jgi:hypothetical protein
MKMLIKMLAAVAVGTTLIPAFAQSAKQVRGASPYIAVEKEPSPKLIVGSPPSRRPGPGCLLGPVPSGEPANRTGIRSGCPPGISTCGASARTSGRPAMVVGRRE